MASDRDLSPTNSKSIDRVEHRYVNQVGAKATVPYNWDSLNQALVPASGSFSPQAFDYVAFSNADGNGNYQTAVFKSGGASGTTVATLAITYDSNNLMTSITRS